MIQAISRFGAALCVAGALSAASASGAVISFQTPTGSSTGGQPVSASALFTTSANQISVTLQNLQADPKSVVQSLSGLQFTVDGGSGGGSFVGTSLTSSSGVERTINGSGGFADGSSAATGWSLSNSGVNFDLNLLGTATSPIHTIIGPPSASNVYANANSSITNGTHSPFLAMSATFVMDVPGVTSTTSINSTTFQFNTGAGNTVTGTPEPTTALAGAALCGILGMRKRMQRPKCKA